MREDITARVADVICRTQHLPEGAVAAESTFEELGIDSLAGLAIVSELETEFGVAIPNDEMYRIRDVPQAVSALAAALGEPGAAEIAGSDRSS
ncbi:MAG TPA: phosphopantetheine-binding protein [Isosphaeraceae bacterium]|jgi:acyl carrier protein